MPKKTRKLIWLTSILIIPVIIYACSPWIIKNLLKQQLSEFGFTDLNIQTEYPGWTGIHLSSISLAKSTATQHLSAKVADVEITYKPWELLTGTITRVHIPVIKLQLKTAENSSTIENKDTEVPPVALASGQWLTNLPVRELRVDNLEAEININSDSLYKFRSYVDLQEGTLKTSGTVYSTTLPQQLMFAITTNYTGKSKLIIHTGQQNPTPVLDLEVNSITNDKNEIVLNGITKSEVSQLLKNFAPKLETKWIALLTGEISSEWVVHFSSHPQTAHIDAKINAADRAITIQLNGQYQLASSHATAKFRLLPLAFSQSSLKMSQLVRDWPYSFDIIDGTITARGSINWKKQFKLQADIVLDNLAGYYNKITFAGLKAKLPLQLDPVFRTSNEIQLQLKQLDVGFPVKDTHARLDLSPNKTSAVPLIHIRDFNAKLLGGSISTNKFELDFGRKSNNLLVKLEHIGLNEIIQLEQQEGLQASGVLDGQIPVQIVDKEVLVTQGHLSARAPGGLIRYTPTAKVAALAKSNSSIGLMVKALSNFQYNVLDVNSDYKSGGDLELKVRLEGHNPEWQSGRPVNLNLNLHENIPVLLRSLQIGDEISEQVRKRYENSP